MNPKISVILPVFNAEKTIAESIESILNQTYKDFELIIINDGSSDKSESIILSFQDERINYFINEKNKGLIFTLNRGIDLANGEYIARMDADDIAYLTRFEKQIKVMEENSDLIVCGTQINSFGEKKNNKFKFVAKENSKEIKLRLVLESALAHPTVFIRRSILIDNNIRYNKDYLHTEDYKLWTDLSTYGNFYNIQEPLLNYRVSETQVSKKWHTIQLEIAKKCRREYICKLLNNNLIKNDIINQQITIHTLKELKKTSYINEVLEVFYMSLNCYSLKELLYFILSADWLKFRFITNLAILKRFIKGKNPVI